ncbi:phage tail tape measure protein [Flavobacterium cerinum]|uniref:Phage tail tape measure protein n=1 Tax=Flavobacterium cerinum TaxID=2502784 RepID=A0A444HBZ6_9FLAO|nr:phage tail tape measure protein [Flavobacterium cerinum]RWX00913.1 phage tail tape measure protein [Flavobacterium cerinum]
MSNTLFNYIFKITSDAKSVAADMGKLHASVVKVDTGATHMDKSFTAAFNHMRNDIKTIKLDSILNQIDRTAAGIETLNQPGMDLSSNMFELSAMTGVAGAKLKEIEGYARATGKEFALGAAGGAESFKLILGQLSPEIAKFPTALDAMGKSVAVTSKLMKNDQVGAANLLTTAMNQYGVSLEDPVQASAEMAKMMNTMAAAAGEGSAELPAQQAALEQSGMAANAAKVSFEETAASIQVLDKAGKKGSEGGVALRNTLAKLSEGRFLPKDVQAELAKAGVNINTLGDKSLSLADRLTPLKKIMGDSALITKLFGTENSNAALALISGIDEQRRLTAAITDTNAAYDQAAIIMESPMEKNKRLQAQIDDFKISIFNGTNGLIGYASVIGKTASDFGNLLPVISGAGKVFSTLTSATKLQALWTGIVAGATSIWTGVQGAFNVVMAMNPIVLIVLGVMALIAAIVWVASVTEGWGEAWDHTVKGAKLIFQAYVEGVKLYFSTMVNGIMIGINMIKEGWYEFKNSMGIGDEADNNRMLAKIHADTEARKKAITDGAKKVADLAVQGANEFALAANSIKMKPKEEAGISDPAIPGIAKTANSGGGGAASSEKTKTNQAIATGGTKHNYITINLKDLVGVLNIKGSDFKDSAQQMETQVADALGRLLAMSTTASN